MPWRWLAYFIASTVCLEWRVLKIVDSKSRKILREWSKPIGTELMDELKRLQINAETGNSDDVVIFKVATWNAFREIGDSVLYKKSELEGNCISRTISKAYVLETYSTTEGTLKGVIDLEHIGMASLDKVVEFDLLGHLHQSGNTEFKI